jgi:flagellar export protein FliJ
MLEEQRLGDLEHQEEQCVRATVFLQTGTVRADEVARCYQHLELIGLAIKEQKNKVDEIGKRVEMLRMMLVGAERDRKVFEKLDEKEREEFLRTFSKHEQAVLDEVGLNRFAQRQAHSRIHSSQQQ